MSRAFLMAGFEVTLNGRFWVTPEDLDCVTRRDTQDRRHGLAVKGECIPTFRVRYCMESQEQFMIARMEFRRFGKWRAVVSSDRDDDRATNEGDNGDAYITAAHQANSFDFFS